LVLCAGTDAFAHDTWLLPASHAVAVGARLELALTSGMAFPRLESALKAERLASRGVRLAGQGRPLEVGAPSASALKLAATLDHPGLATIWIETHPRPITLGPKQVEEYLDEIGVKDTIGRQWKASGQQGWREVYVKLAKTYVRVGDAAGDRSWAEPVGLALEIVPETDPTAIRAGDDMPVRVIWQGKPLAGFPVGAVGPDSVVTRTTDAGGRAAFRLDRAGRWMLRGTLLREGSSSEADWHSHFTTLTLSAAP